MKFDAKLRFALYWKNDFYYDLQWFLLIWHTVNFAKNGEAKSAKRSFGSKIKIEEITTRSFASRSLLRYATAIVSEIFGFRKEKKSLYF
jgi:hypothetical protein